MITPRTRDLRGRILWAFGGFAVAMAAVFGLSTAVFLYTVEDEFFNALLSEEAALLEQRRTREPQWGAPRQPWMTVHESPTTMPADLGAQLAAEPNRREFRGDAGRHYHLRRLGPINRADSVPPAWLVSEVSGRLVVRPMRVELLEKWLVVEALILLLAVGLALRIARRIAQPLSTLADAVRTFDPSLPVHALVISNADAEVMVVARALDDMRSRVQALVAREQAFTRDASHELRTPLSVIRSTAAQVLQDSALTPASRRMLTLALQSAEQMERTVASLLALARDTTRDTTRDTASGMPAQSTRVLPVVEQVVIDQSPALDGRDVSLAIDVPGDATLHVSGAVLHILLSNLIGNAFMHTASGVVRVSFAQQQLVLSNPLSTDTGYDAFAGDVRALGARGAKREDSPGFGLGLDIAQRLCDRAGLALEWQIHDGAFQVTLGGTT